MQILYWLLVASPVVYGASQAPNFPSLKPPQIFHDEAAVIKADQQRDMVKSCFRIALDNLEEKIESLLSQLETVFDVGTVKYIETALHIASACCKLDILSVVSKSTPDFGKQPF